MTLEPKLPETDLIRWCFDEAGNLILEERFATREPPIICKQEDLLSVALALIEKAPEMGRPVYFGVSDAAGIDFEIESLLFALQQALQSKREEEKEKEQP